MAWNPSPKVADCRDIAKKWGDKSHIIILALDIEAGTLEMATYGKNRHLCDEANLLGNAAYDAVIAQFAETPTPAEEA